MYFMNGKVGDLPQQEIRPLGGEEGEGLGRGPEPGSPAAS